MASNHTFRHARQFETKRYRVLIRTQNPSTRMRAGAQKALALFRRAAQDVPAYKDFLRRMKIDPGSIRTIKDFSRIPPTTKDNYIVRYAPKERSWSGTLDGHTILAASSGTSGEPVIWPRGEIQEREATCIHDFLFTDLYGVDRLRTLIIIGFPMGIYVSGIATAVPTITALFDRKGVLVAPVGNNKESFLKVVREAQKDFEQLILVGHPFFIKDVIKTGTREGVRWSQTCVSAFFCSEGFTEAWRDYVALQAHAKPARFFNTYGSSEFLLVGFENPHTLALRRRAFADDTVRQALFDSAIVPNLFQYDPTMRYIESDGTDLMITACSGGTPLIRFNQHDAGQVIPFSSLQTKLPPTAYREIAQELKGCGWRPWLLPFVTLYNRSDRTLKFYAANIYPEHIMQALNHRSCFRLLTGKFVMEKRYQKNMDERLHIKIELQAGIRSSKAFTGMIQRRIVDTLERINMEYLFLRNHLAKDIVPRIELCTYQDPRYFKAGLKPRYTV